MKQVSKNIVGHAVAVIRNHRKPILTQLDLSKALKKVGIEIDRAGIAKIENGMRYVLDYELAGLSKVLKVPVSKLLASSRSVQISSASIAGNFSTGGSKLRLL